MNWFLHDVSDKKKGNKKNSNKKLLHLSTKLPVTVILLEVSGPTVRWKLLWSAMVNFD